MATYTDLEGDWSMLNQEIQEWTATGKFRFYYYCEYMSYRVTGAAAGVILGDVTHSKSRFVCPSHSDFVGYLLLIINSLMAQIMICNV